MKTSLSHLPESKQQDLDRITQLIAETADPEKVILFGSYATDKWQEDRYDEQHTVYEFDSDYDILVITKEGDPRKDYEISSQIVNRARYRVPINVITHDIGYINKQLSIGQYFFTEIIGRGILLFDAGNTSFVEPKELTKEERSRIAQKDFEKWFPTSLTFLHLAIHSKDVLKKNKEAAFLLHQSAERTYHAVLLVFTGYKPKTHNLDKLRTLAKKFSPALYSVFPSDTKIEAHLFSLLQKGYIDARYSDTYSITVEELDLLIERVKTLQSIAEKICKVEIQSV